MGTRRVRRVLILGSLLAVAGIAAGVVAGVVTADSPAYRAFTAESWWNRPLPVDAPRHERSDGIVQFLRETNVRDGCVLLSGVDGNRWGEPVYWAEPSDPTYDVAPTRYALPPEMDDLRIPRGAEPGLNSDAELVVYDLDRGTVAWLWGAVYDEGADRWSARGGSIAYLDGNGLHRSLPGGDPRNDGSHRGLNGAVTAVRADEVAAGSIDHVVKVAVSEVATRHVFPMTGSDGDSADPDAPAQGTRLRIRPDVDLDAFGLHPQARVIAEAFQTYGMIVGDSSGAPVELKLEDTVRAGRGQAWDLGHEALCAVPLSAFEVIADGYQPP